MTDLLPCPMCGSGTLEVSKTMLPPGVWHFHMDCQNCSATNGYYLTEAEAIAAWNTRPPATQADALVATDPYSVVGEILEYFDSYSLATWAPVAAIIARERAAAHAAGRAEREAEVVAWLKSQQNWMNPLAGVYADDIERGQDGSKEPKP